MMHKFGQTATGALYPIFASRVEVVGRWDVKCSCGACAKREQLACYYPDGSYEERTVGGYCNKCVGLENKG